MSLHTLLPRSVTVLPASTLLERCAQAALGLVLLLTGPTATAQCLTGNDSGFPAFTPTCSGAIETVSSSSSAGVFNTVNLTAGSIYTFRSSVAGDYITISNSTGTTALAWGFNPISFSPTSSGVYRFYLHTNASCGTQAVSRTRTIQCTLNDLVCNAIQIDPGSTTTGSTGATTSTGTYEGTTTCGVAQSQPGVWYRVNGVTGATFTASLCQSAGFNSRISVYSGTCTSLTCIGGNDDNGPSCNGTPASFSWATTTGITYFIKVHGASGTGAFTLALSPANDQVCAAQDVTCGSSVNGSTLNATGTGEGGDVCGFGQGSVPAVWYRIQGTTGRTITASLCATAWDSRIAVYSGTCGALTCIGGNDTNGPACASASASYSWQSLTGTTYYIKVWGFSSNNNFVLNTTCVDEVPANDEACNATNISCNSTTAGYTVNATSTGASEGSTTCGVAQTQAGVWYRVYGQSGSTLTASLCGTAGWNSRISVYSGSCSALNCIGGNDDNGPACGGTPASFSWNGANTFYWIKVHGAGSNDAFSLNVSCTTPVPANDLVCSPWPLSCGTFITGTTLGATDSGIYEGTTTCGVPQAQPGVWYSVAGSTGTTYRVTTCGEGSLDSRVSVYTGSCTGLTCIGGNDNNGPGCTGNFASYEWPSVTGVTYFIKVHGAVATGGFGIGLVCLPTNDLVCDAQPLTCNTTVPGRTTFGTSTGTDEGTTTCGVAQSMPGVWYTLQGITGNIHTVSLCGTAAWDSRISVYSGTCTGLTCIGGNDNDGPSCSGTPASFSWPGTTGTTYYIKVHGGSSNSAFNVNVTCGPPPPANDQVCDAQAVSCDSSTPGTTVNATSTGTFESTTTCGVAQSQPAVWYTTTGTTGQVITASLCATSGWDSRIAVYQGTCGALTCIGGNDANGPACTGGAASFQWAATTGVTYYIKVFGNSSTSAFTLNVSCGAPPTCNAAYTSPANGADVCSATTVTLSWPAVATATGYDVYLDQGSANVLASSNQAGTSYVAAVAAGTPYNWRVVPRNANGTPTAACPVWTFTRYAPPAPASVGGPQTICPLGTTSQLSPTPSIGTWSVVSGGTGTFSNASSWFATFTHTSGAGPIVLRWTITSGTCPPSTGDVTVNITPAPSTATVGGTQTICALGTTTGRQYALRGHRFMERGERRKWHLLQHGNTQRHIHAHQRRRPDRAALDDHQRHVWLLCGGCRGEHCAAALHRQRGQQPDHLQVQHHTGPGRQHPQRGHRHLERGERWYRFLLERQPAQRHLRTHGWHRPPCAALDDQQQHLHTLVRRCHGDHQPAAHHRNCRWAADHLLFRHHCRTRREYPCCGHQHVERGKRRNGHLQQCDRAQCHLHPHRRHWPGGAALDHQQQPLRAHLGHGEHRHRPHAYHRDSGRSADHLCIRQHSRAGRQHARGGHRHLERGQRRHRHLQPQRLHTERHLHPYRGQWAHRTALDDQ